MRRRLLSLCLLVALAGTARADEPPSPRSKPASPHQAALAFYDAWRAEDDARMRTVAEAWEPDPFLVADDLLRGHVARTLAEPPVASDLLEAASAHAALCASRKDAGHLADVVRGWRALDAAALRREAGLHGVLRRVQEALEKGDARAAAAAAEAAAKDPGLPDGSVTAQFVRYHGARALFKAGRPEDALAWAEAGLAVAEPLGWLRMRSYMLGIGEDAAKQVGDHPRVIEYATASLELNELLGWRMAQALIRFHLSDGLRAAGRYREALEQARLSRVDAEALGQPLGVASALQAMGLLEATLGRWVEGLRLLDQAAEQYRLGGEPRGVAKMQEQKASILKQAGRRAEALSLLERTLEAYRRLGDSRLVASALGSIGECLVEVGRTDEGIARLEAALEESRTQEAAMEVARWTYEIGLAEQREGRHDRAVERFHAASKIQEGRGNKVGLAATYRHLAESLTALGRLDEADETASRAEDLHLAMGMPEGAWEDRAARARVLEARGRNAEAVALLEEVVRLQAEAGLPGRVSVFRALASARLAVGDAGGAMEAARRAVRIDAKAARGFAESEASGLLDVARTDADLGVRAAGLSARGKPSAAADALWFAETGRAAWLAQGLVHRDLLASTVLPPDLWEADAMTRARVDGLQRRLLRAAFGPRPDPAAAKALRLELATATKAREAAVARIQREAGVAGAALFPEAVDLDALRKALPADTAFVLYHAVGPEAFAIVVAGDASGLVPLGASEPILEKARAYARLASGPDAPEEFLARELHGLLVAPLEATIGRRQRVVIAPDGALAFLPFEALAGKAGGATRRLVERWDVAYVPSATVYEALRRGAAATPPGEGLLALGDPVYPEEGALPNGRSEGAVALLRGLVDLGRLPATGEEVKDVAALFAEGRSTVLLRERATVDGLSAALAASPGRLRALHLACHGFVDPEHPGLSGLVLSGGDVLSLDALYRMKIDADLAVLSACETGRGKLVRSEGVMGLARGFFFAGVPRVVVSDWMVSDASTRPFMRRFYEGMRKGGLSPAAALRRAKLDAIEAGGPTAHPYHWAAFVLWGLPD
jgi:CHAT domain-containing protein/tetratricopeptide (TPR) repeat protein